MSSIERYLDKMNVPDPARRNGSAAHAARGGGDARHERQIKSGASAAAVEAAVNFQPFPTDALPWPVRDLAVSGAAAMGVDPSFVAAPAMAVLAAAIGNTRRIHLKRAWSEPAVLWTAIIAESGAVKSPPLDLATEPMRARQQRAAKDHAARMAEHQNELLRYEVEFSAWKREQKQSSHSDPPEKPTEPVAERCWCSDTTVEAVAPLLLENWRGLLLVRDELSGWIGGFDAYSNSRGKDVAKWLEMHGGRSMIVDRKTGQPRTIYVPRAAVSVTGTIQPAVLRRVLSQQYRDNGLAARLLFAAPPRRQKRWSEADVAESVQENFAALLEKLYELQPARDVDGEPLPSLVKLSPDAKRLWVQFYNEHAEQHENLSGDLSACWSKLEGYSARLALIVHLSRAALGETDDPLIADAASVEAGITLSRWFGNEAKRVYALFTESDADRERRELVELIQRRGGSVTARELMHASRKYRTDAGGAEAALDELARSGSGAWQVTPTAGRDRREFWLT